MSKYQWENRYPLWFFRALTTAGTRTVQFATLLCLKCTFLAVLFVRRMLLLYMIDVKETRHVLIKVRRSGLDFTTTFKCVYVGAILKCYIPIQDSENFGLHVHSKNAWFEGRHPNPNKPMLAERLVTCSVTVTILEVDPLAIDSCKRRLERRVDYEVR